jgi:hypothetical protein
VRWIASSAISVVLAGFAAGCAGQTTSSAGNFHGPDAAVAKVVDDLQTASSSHNTAKICNQLFASDLAKRLTAAGGSCQKVVGKQLDNVDTFTTSVVRVAISGNQAQAVVKSTNNGKDKLDLLRLVKAPDGSWRIESLG